MALNVPNYIIIHSIKGNIMPNIFLNYRHVSVEAAVEPDLGHHAHFSSISAFGSLWIYGL